GPPGVCAVRQGWPPASPPGGLLAKPRCTPGYRPSPPPGATHAGVAAERRPMVARGAALAKPLADWRRLVGYFSSLILMLRKWTSEPSLWKPMGPEVSGDFPLAIGTPLSFTLMVPSALQVTSVVLHWPIGL